MKNSKAPIPSKTLMVKWKLTQSNDDIFPSNTKKLIEEPIKLRWPWTMWQKMEIKCLTEYPAEIHAITDLNDKNKCKLG